MSTPQKSRLTWSRQPNETGLARVCQAERGKDLKYNGKRIAYVRPLCDGFHRKTVGYYWVARADELKIELYLGAAKSELQRRDAGHEDGAADTNRWLRTPRFRALVK